jgi:hypothetical protein
LLLEDRDRIARDLRDMLQRRKPPMRIPKSASKPRQQSRTSGPKPHRQTDYDIMLRVTETTDSTVHS